jgi:predicted transcriptional regulator
MKTDRKLEVPKVKDMLRLDIIAFTSDFTIFDAIHSLNKFRISSAPVINYQNEVIGYLSEGDCIKSVTSTLYYDVNMSQTIDTIMTQKVAYADQDWDIFELEFFFDSNHLLSAPIVDDENHLVGIVTRSDILLALVKCSEGREDYKHKIKNPVELNTREKIRWIIDLYHNTSRLI